MEGEPSVTGRVGGGAVLSAVDLYHQRLRGAVEVHDVRPDGRLATEAKTAQSLSP